LPFGRIEWVLAAALVGLLAACSSPAPNAVSPHAAAPPPTTPGATTVDSAPVAAAAIAARAHVPILTYHQIRDWMATDAKQDRPYIMSPATFRAELDRLVATGYTTINADQLVAYLSTGTPLPAKPVLLSFDDGTDAQFTVALPELQQRHLTATFFVPTVVIDKPGYFSTDQVRQLDTAGMTIGAHTWDHRRVDKYQGDDWRIQIDQPIAKLAKIIGHPIHYFAYPYGVWSADAFAHLTAAGIVAAFQLYQQPLDPLHPLLTIHREIANPYWSPTDFDTKLTSF
jgi:peptidoglycan/xylan/chitin deacetylase (PgdA/CDA1 family)